MGVMYFVIYQVDLNLLRKNLIQDLILTVIYFKN
jgi:hypothetical protein